MCGTSHVSLMTAACKLTSRAQSVFLFLSFHFFKWKLIGPTITADVSATVGLCTVFLTGCFYLQQQITF